MTKSEYYPHVDGLRAVSVAIVVLYHARFIFPGGFVGVDAFFVISGFVISGLILRDLENDAFSFKNFSLRRMRRILPAQWSVVCTVIILSWLLFLESDFHSVLRTAMANCLMAANISLWSMIGYFDNSAKLSPLLHLWSLAIEEQFYLLFPVFLVGVWKYAKRALGAVLIAATLGSFFLSAYAATRHPSANFFLLPFRAWELTIGSLLAYFHIPSLASSFTKRWVCDLIGGLGFALLFGSALFYTDQTSFPGATALVPCMGAALLIAAGANTSCWTYRILSIIVFQGLGRISYSLYLWHWPLLVFASYWLIETVPWYVRACAVLFAIPLSYFSWLYIETPWRTSGPSQNPNQARLFFRWLSTTALVNVGVTVVCILLFLSKYQPLIPDVAQQYARGVADRELLNTVTLNDAREGDFPRIGLAADRCDVLLWGDSHAMATAPAIDAMCKRFQLSGIMATHSSTPPLLNFVSRDTWGLNEQNVEFSTLVTHAVATRKIKLVILVGVWQNYAAVVPENSALMRFDDALKMTVEKLQDSGAKVALMLEVPKQQSAYIPRLLARDAFLGRNTDLIGVRPEDHFERYSAINKHIRQACNEDVLVLDPAPLFLNDYGLFGCELGGHALYADSHHLTVHGSQLLLDLFQPVFESSFGSLPVNQEKAYSN